MALEAELNETSYETLNDVIKSEYVKSVSTVKDADGTEKEVVNYVLQVAGVDNASSLVKALEHRKQEEADLKTQLKNLQKKLKEVDDAKSRSEKEKAVALQQRMAEEGRYQEALEMSQRTLAEERAEWERVLREKEDNYKKVVLDKEVKTFAVTNGGIIPELLNDFYKIHKERFDIGPNGEIICLDKQGKMNNLSLEKQFSLLREETKWAAKTERKGGGGNSNSSITGHNNGVPTINLKNGNVLRPTKEMVEQMDKLNFNIDGFRQIF